jgi:hypothetical protein
MKLSGGKRYPTNENLSRRPCGCTYTKPTPASMMTTRWSHRSATGLEVDVFGGFRLTEWAQETGASCLSSTLLDEAGVPKAFCLPDLKFCLCNNRRVTLREAFRTPEQMIHRAIVTFTHQKNGNNGEKRTFVRNSSNPCLCFVALMLRISKQFIHLVGWEATSTPLAIY